jgi:hypothetical protein
MVVSPYGSNEDLILKEEQLISHGAYVLHLFLMELLKYLAGK